MAGNSRKTTPQPMPDQEILNIDGAAALLGVSVKTFSKVLRDGDVPGRKVGREWKFSRQALIDWIGSSRSRAFLDQGERPEEDVRPRTSVRGASPARRRKTAVDDGFSVDEM